MDPNNPNPGPDAATSARAADAARDIRETFRQILRDGNDFNDIIKDQVRELGKLTTHYNKVRASIDGFRTSSLDIKRIQQDINKTKSQEFVQASKILETELKLKIAGEQQFKGAEKYLGILSEKEQKEEQIRKAAERGDRNAITSLKNELDEIEGRVAAEAEMLTPLQGEYIARKKSQEVLKLTTKELEQQLIKEKEIKSSIGLTGVAFENFSKKLGLGDSVYEAMINKARELQAQNEASAKKEELRNKLIEKNKIREAYNIQAVAQGRQPIPLFEIPKPEGFFAKIKTQFADVKKSVNDKGFFTSISDGLKNSTKSFGTSLMDVATNAPKKIKAGFTNAFNSLKAAPGQLLTNFKVFGAGLNAMFKGALQSLKDPAVLALIAGKIGSSLMNVFSGATKMLSSGMKSVGGELADGPIQNLVKPISGFLEKIPLVGGLLGGLVDMMATFFDFAVNATSQFVKMGRELGLSADESQKLANQFSDFANNTNDAFLNSKKLYEAQIGLSKTLGTTAILSNEILATNIRLNQVLGLDAETQARIAEASTITAKDSKSIVGNIIAQVANLKKAGLATQDWKAVIKEVSNLGGYLGLTFAKYPEKITKAVLQTKAMGLELKQLDSMADSFLDFESSISKEMEAQLLTGKDINLSKAREAFLNNDLAGAAKEITDQVGSASDFLKLNRIAAESMAGAFGMTRDTMGEMLKKQEFLAKIGAKDTDNAQKKYELAKKTFGTMADITNEQEKQEYQALANGSAQEKLAALIDKIKQGFVDLVSNSGVSQFIDKAINWMSKPENIQGMVNGVKNFFAQVLEVAGSMVNAISKVANVFLFGDDEIREDYGDQLKDFGSTLRSSNLGSLSKKEEKKEEKTGKENTVKPKAERGGFVEKGGNAVIDTGEFYFGKDSAQYVKEMGENTKRTNELLEQLARKGGTNDKIQISAAPIFLGDTKVGSLILNSFENNQYSKFDRGNLFT